MEWIKRQQRRSLTNKTDSLKELTTLNVIVVKGIKSKSGTSYFVNDKRRSIGYGNNTITLKGPTKRRSYHQ